jgi:multidrug efflux pump subunit AcrB
VLLFSRRLTLTLTLSGLSLILAGCFQTDPSGATGPVLRVQAVDPGAGSQEIATEVAGPIETAFAGAGSVAQLRSQCGPGGVYSLDIALERGSDVKRIEKLLRERLEVAKSASPPAIRGRGVTLRQRPAGTIGLIVLGRRDGDHKELEIDPAVEMRVVGELSRLPGVASVTSFGRSERARRFHIDADRLTLFGLKTADVRETIERVANAEEKPNALSRLTMLEQLLDVNIRTQPGGSEVPLRSVAVAEEGLLKWRYAFMRGKPVLVLGVTPKRDARPEELSAGLHDLVARQEATLAPDIDIKLAIDFTPVLDTASTSSSRFLMLDLVVLENVLPEAVIEQLESAETALRGIPGIEEVVVLSERPFDVIHDRPCILIRAARPTNPANGGDILAKAIRDALKSKMTLTVFQLREISSSGGTPAVDIPFGLALHGPPNGPYDALVSKAERVIKVLADCPGIADLMLPTARSPHDAHFVEIDEQAIKSKDITWDTAFEALRTGPMNRLVPALILRTEPATAGRPRLEQDRGPWMLPTQPGDKAALERFQTALKNATVHGRAGSAIPLSELVRVRRRSGPDVLERLDGRPMIEIRACLGPGATISDVRKAADRLISEISLGEGYGVTWLR